MPATDFDLLALYWRAEPWGPWRDNLHAALIAREVRRPAFGKDQRKNVLSDFMIRDPEERAKEGQKKITGLFTLFKTIGTRVKASALQMPKRGKKKPRRVKP